jgi:hypothetical protein
MNQQEMFAITAETPPARPRPLTFKPPSVQLPVWASLAEPMLAGAATGDELAMQALWDLLEEWKADDIRAGVLETLQRKTERGNDFMIQLPAGTLAELASFRVRQYLAYLRVSPFINAAVAHGETVDKTRLQELGIADCFQLSKHYLHAPYPLGGVVRDVVAQRYRCNLSEYFSAVPDEWRPSREMWRVIEYCEDRDAYLADLAAAGSPLRRVTFNRFGGGKLPPNTVLCTRRGKERRGRNDWGNNISVPKEKTPESHVYAVMEFRYGTDRPEYDQFHAAVRAELAGKNLACTCPENWPCHADALLEWANTEFVAPVLEVSWGGPDGTPFPTV